MKTAVNRKEKLDIISRITLILYALALFMLHFIRIFDQNFWADEAFTINTIRENFTEMIHITAMDVHPPLYYVIVKIFAELFGYTGTIYHLASVVPYGIILILGVTIIWKWFGKETSFILVSFASLLTISIQMNVEVRMYSWGALFVLVAYLALYKLLTDEKKYVWIIFVLASLAAAYTHYYCLISVAFYYLVIIINTLVRERKHMRKMLVACLVTILAYLPWFFTLLETFQRSTDNFWQTEIQPMYQFFECIFYSKYSFVFMLFFIFFLVAWIVKERAFSVKMIWVLAGIISIVGTAAVGLLVSVIIRPMFISRYLYAVSIVAWLLFGVCISKFKGKNIYTVLLVGMILLCGIPEYLTIYKTESQSNAKLEQTLELATPLIEDNDIIITNDMYIYWTVANLYYPANRCDYFDFEYPDLEVDKTYWCINTVELSEDKIAVLLDRGLKTELIESDGVLGTYKVWIYKLSK